MSAGKTQPSASVRTPLMDRTVCVRCHHFHRRILIPKCACCRVDVVRDERGADR